MNKDFEELLKEKSLKLGIDLTSNQINNFYEYMTLLLDWNEKINLTAIVEQKDIIIKHFVDSLTIAKYINKGENIVDIGTGAGFPGIPLSIIEPLNKFTLVDSLNKRINFLDDVKNKLNLDNINTIHSRAEEFGQNKNYRENFDVAVSRAVANLSVLVEYLMPTVKVNGKIICMKGNDIEEELNEAKFAIKELGGEINKVEEFVLPDTDIKRTIIVIQKVKNTPIKYPRKPGTPSKQPLKK